MLPVPDKAENYFLVEMSIKNTLTIPLNARRDGSECDKLEATAKQNGMKIWCYLEIPYKE